MLEFLETKLFWITALAGAVYLYLKCYVYNYWQRHGVPCETPTIPLGNIPFSHFFGKISTGDFVKENYDKFRNHPFHGFYTFFRPTIVINDLELIRTVLVKEFHRFPDRGWFSNEKVDPLSRHIFLLPGAKWKNLRAKLSPVFTSGKLKQMYPLFEEVSNEMINTCDADLRQSDVLEIKDIVARYTTDIISSVVYGFNCCSLKDPTTQFRRLGITAIEFDKLSLLVGIFVPEFLEKLELPLMKKETSDFFVNAFNDMIDYRHKEKIVRKDFLNLLMQLMDHGTVEEDGKSSVPILNGHSNEGMEKLSASDAAAQAFVFFVAGYETASSTATYCLLELAMNPKVQDKLREEVDKMAETTGITYDSVMGNEYLDMVFSETLRKHPSVPYLNRICVEDFPIPNSNFTIPKGMRLIISASGIHRNPEFYPDPEKFDPMRFSKENNSERNSYLQLGFGAGPRYCIGKRFGQLQGKQAVVTMIRNYKFYISDKTLIPPKYTARTFVQAPEKGVFLRIVKRDL